MPTIKLYECDICGGLHPWEWRGDCRDNANRYGDAEDFAVRKHVNIDDIEILTMEDRINADRD